MMNNAENPQLTIPRVMPCFDLSLIDLDKVIVKVDFLEDVFKRIFSKKV